MEVSSIGLEELRVSGLHFEAALFTNLTYDHIEYHKTFENYTHAKSKLFTNLKESSPIVANRDDINYQKVVGNRGANIFTFGKANANKSDSANSVNFEIVENSMNGLTLNIDGHTEKYLLSGEFNAYNIAAAYSTLTALGYKKSRIIKALSRTKPPAGRFQIVNPDFEQKNEPVVVVDFAHTPDAIENLLSTVRTVTNNERKVITVFGCAGGRGEEKRPKMAAIAEKLSNFVIVTSTLPKNEDDHKIAQYITRGFSKSDSYTVELNRKTAIRKAIDNADDQSIVVLAGLGHYDYQLVKGVKEPA